MTNTSTDGAPDDLAFQGTMLRAVSRTYALTIPVLPDGLRDAVANAYLLCRIADTIEDESGIPAARKRAFWDRLVEVVADRGDGASFGRDLSAALSAATPAAEAELVANTARIARVTAGLGTRQRRAIERCLGTMTRGMMEFQRDTPRVGLRDMAQLDRYCYYAAGVVGELLVELFCAHSPVVRGRRGELLALAPSHAQGLQMSNILNDLWDDWRRGVCWLPRDVFAAEGCSLDNLASHDLGSGDGAPGFRAGMTRLVAITRGHLANALRFIQLVPARERGIRRHLVWALGLAVLALRRVHLTPSPTRGRRGRISRVRAGAMLVVSGIAARRDFTLRLWFRLATRGLAHA